MPKRYIFHFGLCAYIIEEVNVINTWTIFNYGKFLVNRAEEMQYNEINTLAQTLHHNLISLATSLEGRLTPGEEDTLANLFQLQMNLQALLNQGSPRENDIIAPLSASTPSKEVESIVYAQAIQYARDLVKAMRQKKEHQRRLELTSQQLIRAEKLATVGQVAATVAHELNNVLTPLLMYAKLIYQEAAKDGSSDIADFASQITNIANRASDMLRQLVDASWKESATTIPVDVVKIIGNALTLLAPRIHKQNINVVQQYSENLPLVIGNPSQLEQVFINIALNAFDVMPQGGDFTITVKPSEGQVDAQTHSQFISVFLRDTGEGIAPEHMGSIFDPFFTTKARGAGTGLGLFVSYLIVNQHRGIIEVESEPGAGTTFIVKLPTAGRDEK
jgi:signal transduction histidine kinase